MKNSIVIWVVFMLFLGGCGRPKNYKDVGRIDFSSAASSKTLATFNQGIVIIARYLDDTRIKRFFWILPGDSSRGPYDAHMRTGRWEFYAIGYSGSDLSTSNTSFQCDRTQEDIAGGDNNISMTLQTCVSGTNDVLTSNDKILLALNCKNQFNNHFHCGGEY